MSLNEPKNSDCTAGSPPKANDHEHNVTTAVPVDESLIETDASVPPDGGYGWVCSFACCIINSFTWGVMASYGVYLSYYLSHNTFEGAVGIHYAFIGGSNFAAAMVIAPIMSKIIKLLGTNLTIMVGCVIYAAGFVAASFATKFWHLALSQGVTVGIGVGVIWQPSIAILPQWFLKKRSLAQGVASAGSGVGGLIFSLATTPMIEHISLAWSLRITGLTSFVMLMIAALLIRDRNETIRPRAHAFDTVLLREYKPVLLLGWGVFSMLGYIVLLYSLSSYAVSIGLSQSQGGVVIAVQNIGTLIGRPFVGVCSDRWGRITVAMFLTGFTAFATFAIWVPATSFGVLILFGLISGATIGTFWTTIAPLSAEVVGLVDLPSMLSVTWMFIVLPCLFSEVIALELRRPNKVRSYLYPQIYAGVCYIAAALFLLELRRVKWGLWVRERHF